MKERYKVGFEDGASCLWLDRNPGYIPIVDSDSVFVLGDCVALVKNEEIARDIVLGLNYIEKLKQEIKNFQTTK